MRKLGELFGVVPAAGLQAPGGRTVSYTGASGPAIRKNMGKRRGMFIKNVAERPLTIRMRTRTIRMQAGQILLITAEEVRDPVLREHLQVRSIAIVRPATLAEEEVYLDKRFDEESALPEVDSTKDADA